MFIKKDEANKEGNPIDNNSVKEFFFDLLKTPDGALVAILSFASIVMIIAGTEIFCSGQLCKGAKQIVILAFSPIIMLLLTVRLRQLPFSKKPISGIFRALVICAFFIILNF